MFKDYLADEVGTADVRVGAVSAFDRIVIWVSPETVPRCFADVMPTPSASLELNIVWVHARLWPCRASSGPLERRGELPEALVAKNWQVV